MIQRKYHIVALLSILSFVFSRYILTKFQIIITINWKIITTENLEHFFVISSIHLRKQTPNKIPEQFYSKSSLKTFSPLQKSITFSFSLNELMGQEFRTRNSRDGFDEFTARYDKTRAGRRSSLAARMYVGSKPINRRELPWKIRKLNSLLRLFRRIAKRDPRRWKQKYLWPEWGGGREIKKKKKKKGGRCGWIEDKGWRKDDDCRRHPGVVWGATTSEDGGSRSSGRRFEWCKRITAGQKQQIR